LSNFKLGMDVIIKGNKDWRGVGLKLQCIAIATFSSLLKRTAHECDYAYARVICSTERLW